MCKRRTHQSKGVRSDIYIKIVMHKLNHEKSIKNSIHFQGESSKDNIHSFFLLRKSCFRSLNPYMEMEAQLQYTQEAYFSQILFTNLSKSVLVNTSPLAR